MRSEKEIREKQRFLQRVLRELHIEGDWNYGYADALEWALNDKGEK